MEEEIAFGKTVKMMMGLPQKSLLVLIILVEKLSGEEGAKWLNEIIKFLQEPWQKIEHIVDCDAIPEILSKWEIEEHCKMGKVKLENRDGKLYANGQEIIRYLSKNQKNGKVIDGHRLRQELASKKVLNICILEYLLEHPELIPEEWKNGETYFWGTILHRYFNVLVPHLYWTGERWTWDRPWIGSGWGGNDSAACLAETA